MAFDLSAIGNYGNGTLGDVVDPTGVICPSIQFVSSTAGSSYITLFEAEPDESRVQAENYGVWTVGSKLLLVSTDEDSYGEFAVRTITAAQYEYHAEAVYNLKLTLNAPFSATVSVEHGVAVKIAEYRNLTLNSGCYLCPTTVAPNTTYDVHAGILAVMCSGTFTLNGGHIDLRNVGGCGGGSRPGFDLEKDGTLDSDKYSGWENSQTKDRFILNIGDGAAFIVAKKIVVADDSSRIGNPNTTGVQFCRGASDSRNCPENVTNIGGSTILIAAGTITGFTPKLIAKYRSLTASEISRSEVSASYSGLARCYIASDTRLTNDEGLYAYDCISNSARLSSLGIYDFGDGYNGSGELGGRQLNNYAQVTAIDSATRKTLTVGELTTEGVAPLALGAFVMVHFNHKNYEYTAHSGRFVCAKVTGVTDSTVTIDTAVPTKLVNNLSNYNCQIVTIPRYTDATLTSANTATPQYDGIVGGIFAVAVSGDLDIRSNSINVEGKGGSGANNSNKGPYLNYGLRYIGNAQDNNKLPIGHGHGSVFILARNLTMNSSTRIGATYSGANTLGKYVSGSESEKHFGGRGALHNTNYRMQYGGGYSGYNVPSEGAAGYMYAASGYGGGGGLNGQSDLTSQGGIGGGYGSNGSYNHCRQGAHIMIIADKITGFNQAAISTGGEGANTDLTTNRSGGHGSAGYGGGGNCVSGAGGGGGYNGGGGGAGNTGSSSVADRAYGGGSSGWAFIYCNTAVDQNTEDTIFE